MLLLSIVGMGVMILILQCTSGSHMGGGWISLFSSQNRYTYEMVYSVFCCLLVQQIILIEPKTTIAKQVNTLGTKMARFSYTLYLVHFLILRLLEHLGAPKSESISVCSISLWVLWMMVATFICYVLYLCFEKHTKSVKDWIKALPAK